VHTAGEYGFLFTIAVIQLIIRFVKRQNIKRLPWRDAGNGNCNGERAGNYIGLKTM